MAPDLRLDPIGRRHVLLAPERIKRGAPTVPPDEPDPEPCDFCGGREASTPPETFAVRDDTEDDTPGWRVRAVPNLYPSTPFNEVVVHTPDHHARFEDLEPSHRTEVLIAYRDRLRACDLPAVLFSFNRGRAAGASRSHAHGQVFGLERVPPTLEREMFALGESPCAVCEVAREPGLGVTRVDGVRIFAHPVPLVADELLVIADHAPRFDELDDDALAAVAEALADVFGRVKAVHGEGLAFNLVVHTAPAGVERFHWHAHLLPRTAVWGALELGAEVPVVAADPHETAARLREAT